MSREPIILPNLDADTTVRATAGFFWHMPFVPGSPGAERGGAARSGVGRSIQPGQLLPITDPVVRLHPEHFETVSRPLRPEDFAAIDD